jgi:nicotinate phosphoribosyltransferase
MNLRGSALLTDLYQLTMLHAYYVHDMNDTAVFELFVRRLPPQRNFLVAAGLEQALQYLEELHFTDDELAWVRDSRLFRPGFADWLKALRFTGDVHAMPEGTVFFGEEPVLRITAPLPQAQLVETRLLNLVQYQCMIASKAARSVVSAQGRFLVDFGFRRAHGAEAGLLAARAAYIAGFAGTATVLAAPQFGIPVYGTMAHSFVQAHDDESDAFRRFIAAYGNGATLLIDTYDTEEAAHKVVALGRNLAPHDVHIGAVRLDSGDLGASARSVRAILDNGGLGETRIFASGNLDEYRIAALLEEGAPIDGFGLGTSLVTSADAPSLDSVYKLQEYAGKPRFKRSTAKATWPSAKQVFRYHDAHGRMHHDVIAPADDPQPGEPLLTHVMSAGTRLHAPEPLASIRTRTAKQLDLLPPSLRALAPANRPFAIEIAPALRVLAERMDSAFGGHPPRPQQG